MILFFDCETNSLPIDYKAPMQQVENWPRVLQLAWLLSDMQGNIISIHEKLIKCDCWEVPSEPFWIDHGFSTEKCKREGIPIREALGAFIADLAQAEYLVSHNMAFDMNVVGAEMIRLGVKGKKVQKICTMEATIDFCEIPFAGQRAWLSKAEKKFKWPKLAELYFKLFGKDFNDAHSAGGDVAALKECFFELLNQKVIELPKLETQKQ